MLILRHNAALRQRFPQCDLVGMDVELLGKLRHRSIGVTATSATFRLEGRGAKKAHAHSRAHRARRQAETPLTPCADCRDRLCRKAKTFLIRRISETRFR